MAQKAQDSDALTQMRLFTRRSVSDEESLKQIASASRSWPGLAYDSKGNERFSFSAQWTTAICLSWVHYTFALAWGATSVGAVHEFVLARLKC
jgi:hypothetical protein